MEIGLKLARVSLIVTGCRGAQQPSTRPARFVALPPSMRLCDDFSVRRTVARRLGRGGRGDRLRAARPLFARDHSREECLSQRTRDVMRDLRRARLLRSRPRRGFS